MSDNFVSLSGEHRIKQGASFRRSFQCFDRDGLTMDFAGSTGKVQFRRSVVSSVVMLEATSANLKIAFDESNGVVQLLLSGADTEQLTSSGVYDGFVELSTGEIVKAFYGPFELEPRVTL